MISSIIRYVHRFVCCIDPNEYDPNESHRWDDRDNNSQQYAYAPMNGNTPQSSSSTMFFTTTYQPPQLPKSDPDPEGHPEERKARDPEGYSERDPKGYPERDPEGYSERESTDTMTHSIKDSKRLPERDSKGESEESFETALSQS